jgi:hypothetical protein
VFCSVLLEKWREADRVALLLKQTYEQKERTVCAGSLSERNFRVRCLTERAYLAFLRVCKPETEVCACIASQKAINLCFVSHAI